MEELLIVAAQVSWTRHLILLARTSPTRCGTMAARPALVQILISLIGCGTTVARILTHPKAWRPSGSLHLGAQRIKRLASVDHSWSLLVLNYIGDNEFNPGDVFEPLQGATAMTPASYALVRGCAVIPKNKGRGSGGCWDSVTERYAI